jgi:hypothetical protein
VHPHLRQEGRHFTVGVLEEVVRAVLDNGLGRAGLACGRVPFALRIRISSDRFRFERAREWDCGCTGGSAAEVRRVGPRRDRSLFPDKTNEECLSRRKE